MVPIFPLFLLFPNWPIVMCWGISSTETFEERLGLKYTINSLFKPQPVLDLPQFRDRKPETLRSRDGDRQRKNRSTFWGLIGVRQSKQIQQTIQVQVRSLNYTVLSLKLLFRTLGLSATQLYHSGCINRCAPEKDKISISDPQVDWTRCTNHQLYWLRCWVKATIASF